MLRQLDLFCAGCSVSAGHGSCVYAGKNGSALLNGTSLAPSSNSTEGGSGAHRAIGDVSALTRVVSAVLLLSVLLL